MQSKSWHYRRLNDEQLEAAAVRWTDLAGEAYYNHQTKVEEARTTVVCHILDEINRRCAQPPLFEDRPGYGLYGAS